MAKTIPAPDDASPEIQLNVNGLPIVEWPPHPIVRGTVACDPRTGLPITTPRLVEVTNAELTCVQYDNRDNPRRYGTAFKRAATTRRGRRSGFATNDDVTAKDLGNGYLSNGLRVLPPPPSIPFTMPLRVDPPDDVPPGGHAVVI